MKNDLKSRIRNMKIVKYTIKKYMYDLPLYSRDDAVKLLDEIDDELEFFKQSYKNKIEQQKQFSLF